MKLSVFSSKGFRLVAVASVAAFGVFGASNGFAAPASTTATTTAEVVTPIAIVKAQDLSFGEFAAGTGGTIVLTTAGAATPTGDVVLTVVGTTTAAQFTVTGQPDANFSITVSDNDLTHTDTTTVMPFVTTHDLDGATQDDPTSGTLDLGTQTLYVGGTLTVAGAQQPGTYTGSITAEVNYE